MKKLLALWLMLFIPSVSFAEVWQDPETKVNYTYTPGNKNATVKAGEYSYSNGVDLWTAGSPLVTGDVSIRSEFVIDTTTYIVSSIGYSAFANCNGLTCIRIPSGLKTIDNNAFNGCDNLSSIHIPESLTKIDDSAFEGCDNLSAVYIKDLAAWCNVTFTSSGWSNPTISNPLNYAHHLYLNGIEIIDLHIPEGVTTIKSYAFCGGSNIKSIHVPEGVKTIKEGSFKECSSATSIYLPKSLTICESAFDGCDNLSSVHIEDIAAWCEIFWGVSDLSSYYGNGSESANPLSKAHHLFMNGEEVKDVVIPDGVKRVRDYTFAGGSNFSSIRIPPSLTITGMGAFKGCSGLERVDISDLESWCNINFGTSNFQDSDMTPLKYAHHLFLNGEEVIDLIIPESIKELKQMAFYNCSGLENVTIGNNVKTIGKSAFDGCNGMNSLMVSKSVETIALWAFSGCGNLKSIVVEEGNSNFDSRDNCNAIIQTGNNTLIKGCQNTIIPSTVTKIGYSAFSGCTGLTSFLIPSNISNIDYSAFSGCKNLNFITSLIEEPFPLTESHSYSWPFDDDTFWNARLYVPESSINKYKSTEGWKRFRDIRAISNNNYSDTNTGVRYSFDDTNMTAYVTENQSKDLSGEIEILSTITIGGKTYQVTTISGYAFFGCENISSLIIPEGITSIEKYAFAGCKGLTSITIPESVTNIQNNTIFSDCSNLTSVTILCPTVGTWFSGNKTIENVKIGNTVKTIENSAFSNCSNLESVIIDDGIAAIGSYTFGWCKKLIEVKLPQSLTNVGPNAFWYCTALPEIALPEGLVSIGSCAFAGCHALTEITIPENVSSIGEWAFHGCENISKVTSFIKEPFSVNYTAFAFPDTNSASSNYHPTAILYVPIGSVDKYKNTEGWRVFENVQELDKIGGQSISLQIIDKHENTISNGVNIVWFNKDEEQIGTGNQINGIEDGTIILYSILLDEELGRQLKEVNMKKVIMGAKDTTLIVQLESIGKVALQGRVSATDIDKASVTVNVKQMLNGKYEQTYSTETDAQGTFKIEVYDDETEITISGDGYLDTKIYRDGFSGNGNVGTIPLNLISGFAITANIKIEKATTIGQPEEITEWSAGLNNIEFALYNETKSSNISDFTIQNGNVIIKTGAEIGDEIRLTAKSKQEVFADASTIFTIAEGANNFSLLLTELGGIDVTCSSSSNSNTIGYLYNSSNTLIAKASYVGETLSLRHLHYGTYTLVSMGSSTLLGNITSLSNLNEVGLNEGSDYVATSVVVYDGILTEATINEVPRIDDTRFYYTSSDTYFNANKESLTSGNYLTLSAHIDFKPEYSDKVDMMNLSIEIPEGCQIVENSVIANRQAVAHTVDGNRLAMTLNREQWLGQIRFCIIPVLNQTYTLTAMASFDINGNISQPIGTAQFEAKGLSLSTPKYAANTIITINGTAKGHSEVSIYDNDVFIGKTTSKADGSWTAACELYKPYTHSFHDIYAKITTENGMELTSETRQVEYDKTMPIPQTVTMTYYNGWYKENKNVEFNLLEGTTTPTSYPFYSGTDFTFLADFTINDSTLIKNVNIKVLNSDGTVRTLPAQYDGKLSKWVATTYYSSSSKLPQNVSVEFDNLNIENIYNEERELYAEATLRSLFESLNTDFLNFEYEISEELSNGYVFSFFNGGSGQKEYLKLTIENYVNFFTQYGAEEYLMVKNDSINICVKDTISANNYSLLVWDNINRNACSIQYYDKKQSFNSRRRVVPLLLGLGYGIIYNSIDYYLNTEQVKYWYNVLFEKDELLKKQQKKMVDALYAKCSDGKYKIIDSYLMYLNTALVEGWTLSAQLFLSEFERKVNEERRHQANRFFRSSAISGVLSAVAAIGESFLPAVESVNWTSLSNCLKNIGKYAGVEAASQAGNEVVNRGLDHITNTKSITDWYVSESQKLTSEYIDVYKGIIESYSSCKKEDKEKDDKPREEKPNNNSGSNDNIPNDDFNGKGSTPEIDPSGYVYEAVLSNRLEGVTTTCYQKVLKEDMYGDITEEAVVWNAADFSQENPLKTDAMGFYRWDVPQGMWQVKYEKEGYETVYSEWLPVPPPQLDVNVAMTQSTPPTVKLMRGYESGITINMSKYMRPATLNTTNLTVTRNGMAVKGSIDILNSEKEPNGDSEYASKLKFVPESAFDTSDDVIVTVHKEVESYCGVNMLSDNVQKVIIEPEIKEIVSDSSISVPYQSTKDIQVVVLPKSAAAGKILRIQTSSSMIASLDAEDIMLDENGSATLKLNGELPGSAFLTFTIDDTDIMAQSRVKVLTTNDMVATPTASIRSGESVEAGSLLTLTCETEGATIYYTLDGSCPCDEAKRIKYEAPIVIDSDVIVKAIAVKEDMDDSDIATFVYMINGTGIESVESGIRIWPYVTSSTIHIDMKDMKADNISIINMNGMTMYSATNVKGQVTIDLSRYADGMYIINVKCKDGRTVRKIVKIG